ncbi:hypothetical protein, partial [Catenulispora rubra]|uniref:hypothetical protein n=1 Tax=Catenulispora rubra TaxID=280293 RepID=UPI001E5959D1
MPYINVTFSAPNSTDAGGPSGALAGKTSVGPLWSISSTATRAPAGEFRPRGGCFEGIQRIGGGGMEKIMIEFEGEGSG